MSISRNIISTLLITVIVASVFCISVLTNNEVDAATKKIKIKWNANGGKFTAKKYAKKKSYTKKIKKNKKVGTLPKVKRSGYTFKGWYTKKTGGKKITSKTKVKKNKTYYAQWKKGSSKKASTGNTFKLKIYQGFDFTKKSVIDYGDKPELADFKFYPQIRTYPSYAVYYYIGANKIKEFKTPPNNLTVAEVDQWEDYAFAPSPGNYYVIRTRNGKHYIVHLLEFENQGKAISYWIMTFDWKEISVK